jgi:hypothetical protein
MVASPLRQAEITAMKTLSKKYLRGFTCLVAEVADTAMRAVQQADPYHYVENWAKAETLQLARMHRGMTPEDHSDPAQRRAFRLEAVHAKIVRNLALQIIASFDRFEKLTGCVHSRAAVVPLSPASAAIR